MTYEHAIAQTWLHSLCNTHLTHTHTYTHEDAPAYTQPAFIHTLQTNTGTNTQLIHTQIDTHKHTHKGTPKQSGLYTRDSLKRKRV